MSPDQFHKLIMLSGSALCRGSVALPYSYTASYDRPSPYYIYKYASLSSKPFYVSLFGPGRSCPRLAAPPRSVCRTSLWPSWSGSRPSLRLVKHIWQQSLTVCSSYFRKTTLIWSRCLGRWWTITRGPGARWCRDTLVTMGQGGWSGRCRCCWAPPGTRGWPPQPSSTSRTRGPSPPPSCSGVWPPDKVREDIECELFRKQVLLPVMKSLFGYWKGSQTDLLEAIYRFIFEINGIFIVTFSSDNISRKLLQEMVWQFWKTLVRNMTWNRKAKLWNSGFT